MPNELLEELASVLTEFRLRFVRSAAEGGSFYLPDLFLYLKIRAQELQMLSLENDVLVLSGAGSIHAFRKLLMHVQSQPPVAWEGMGR